MSAGAGLPHAVKAAMFTVLPTAVREAIDRRC